MKRPVRVDHDGAVTVVTIDRPEVRNAVDDATATALTDAFTEFDRDPDRSVAVLTGADGMFCSGADLKAVAERRRDLDPAPGDHAPMGPTRMLLSKPVIAAVEGYAVAGGLELALWCDLRVASTEAVLGVFCRRWGVPLIDGGTVRLPRLIGHSHALDMILTGRGVGGEEAQRIGLVNRLTEPGRALAGALELAHELAALPQACLCSDRRSSYEQDGLPIPDALAREAELGMEVVRSGDAQAGAARFAAGEGRHGTSATS